MEASAQPSNCEIMKRLKGMIQVEAESVAADGSHGHSFSPPLRSQHWDGKVPFSDVPNLTGNSTFTCRFFLFRPKFPDFPHKSFPVAVSAIIAICALILDSRWHACAHKHLHHWDLCSAHGASVSTIDCMYCYDFCTSSAMPRRQETGKLSTVKAKIKNMPGTNCQSSLKLASLETVFFFPKLQKHLFAVWKKKQPQKNKHMCRFYLCLCFYM